MTDRSRRKQAERAIIYAGVVGELSNARIDELLDQVGGRPLDPGSYAWIKRSYVPYFQGDPARLGKAIEHPPTASQVKAALELDREAEQAALQDLSVGS